MSQIAALTRDQLGPLLLEEESPAVIDVWGPQCAPCLALGPLFEELAKEYGDKARFFKLEAPRNRMACVDLKVMSLPTFLFYESGEESDRLSGDVSNEQLREWIEGIVK